MDISIGLHNSLNFCCHSWSGPRPIPWKRNHHHHHHDSAAKNNKRPNPVSPHLASLLKYLIRLSCIVYEQQPWTEHDWPFRNTWGQHLGKKNNKTINSHNCTFCLWWCGVITLRLSLSSLIKLWLSCGWGWGWARVPSTWLHNMRSLGVGVLPVPLSEPLACLVHQLWRSYMCFSAEQMDSTLHHFYYVPMAISQTVRMNWTVYCNFMCWSILR